MGYNMSALFEDVYVSPAVQDMTRGTLLAWRMSSDFVPASSTPEFTIHVSRSGMVDDWTVAGATTSDHFIHADRQYFAVNYAVYYAVTVADARGNVTSGVLDVTNYLNKRDATLAAEMIRKESLLLTQYNGVTGYLYKRRHWGTNCPECSDHDFGSQVNSSCPYCYGTGFSGGYHGVAVTEEGVNTFTPYAMAVLGSSPDKVSTEDKTGTVGTVNTRSLVCRGLACPRLQTADLWLDCSTDMRYIIKTVEPVLFRNVPIAYSKINMILLQSSDVAYQLPRG